MESARRFADEKRRPGAPLSGARLERRKSEEKKSRRPAPERILLHGSRARTLVNIVRWKGAKLTTTLGKKENRWSGFQLKKELVSRLNNPWMGPRGKLRLLPVWNQRNRGAPRFGFFDLSTTPPRLKCEPFSTMSGDRARASSGKRGEQNDLNKNTKADPKGREYFTPVSRGTKTDGLLADIHLQAGNGLKEKAKRKDYFSGKNTSRISQEKE